MLKYMRYQGRKVHDRPGFDVHGLPIENRLERQLNFKSKGDIERYGIANFVKACFDYVNSEVASSIVLMNRFGVHMDYDTVYLPYKRSYMNRLWGMFSVMYKKGLLYKDLKPLAYCPHCETVLSAQGPEVEYQDESDNSLYVRYKISESRAKLEPNTYLVIWTTTPWTLPSNMAIGVNAKATYVVASTGKENYIVAKDRFDAFAADTGLSLVIRGDVSGSDLVGTHYTSPLEKKVPIQKKFAKYHRVIDGKDFVTLTEGTGLLHIAPGHGPEDYTLAKENRIPTFSPIDIHAKYNEDAGEYKGLNVPAEANGVVLKDLKESGDLLYSGSLTHTYPHCWRCHSKLIYRATDQWFVNVSKIKKKMLKENEKITWYPKYAQKWFADAVESSPDWCISRQRYWGTPLPIWICEKCNEMEVLGSIDELVKRGLLKEPIQDLMLHKPHIDSITFKCKKCDGTMKRVTDIFDVWYESGSAHTASLDEEEFKELYPADWITESLDQIRGWFTTMLRTAVAVHGKTSYMRVTIGGMMKDEFGGRMHRSHGNAVSPDEMLKAFSADGMRLFFLSKPRWLDLKLKEDEIKDADSEMIMLYNISELAKEFADQCGYDLKSVKKPGISKLESEDLFILSRMNSLITNVTKNMNEYKVDDAINELRSFVVEDFSRFYLKFAKRRAVDATKGQMKRIANITAYLLYNTIIMMSIATPFATESIYQKLFSRNKDTIFLEKWPKPSKKMINAELERKMDVAKDVITAILNSREKANVPLRWPIAKATVEITDDDAYKAVEDLSGIIENYTNAKKLELKRVSGMKKEIKPVFAKLGPDFKDKAGAVANALKSADYAELAKAIDTDGYYSLHTDKGTVDIKPEHFTAVEMVEGGDAALFKYGKAYVDKEITKELKDEGLLREFERAIQMIRKEMGLKKADRITLNYETVGELRNIIEANQKKISKDLKAKIGGKLDHEALKKDLEIEGETVKVSVKKS